MASSRALSRDTRRTRTWTCTSAQEGKVVPSMLLGFTSGFSRRHAEQQALRAGVCCLGVYWQSLCRTLARAPPCRQRRRALGCSWWLRCAAAESLGRAWPAGCHSAAVMSCSGTIRQKEQTKKKKSPRRSVGAALLSNMVPEPNESRLARSVAASSRAAAGATGSSRRVSSALLLRGNVI